MTKDTVCCPPLELELAALLELEAALELALEAALELALEAALELALEAALELALELEAVAAPPMPPTPSSAPPAPPAPTVVPGPPLVELDPTVAPSTVEPVLLVTPSEAVEEDPVVVAWLEEFAAV